MKGRDVGARHVWREEGGGEENNKHITYSSAGLHRGHCIILVRETLNHGRNISHSAESAMLGAGGICHNDAE